MRYEFVGQYNKKDLLIFEDDGITLLLETPDLIINKFFPYGCLNSIKSLRGGFEAKAIPGHGDKMVFFCKEDRSKRDEAVAMANEKRKNAPLADMIDRSSPKATTEEVAFAEKRLSELQNMVLSAGSNERDLKNSKNGLEYLAKNIKSDEDIYYCMTTGPIYGFAHSIGNSAIAVTNNRVVFAGTTSDFIKTVSTFSLELDRIESVDAEAGTLAYTMWITTAGNKIKCTYAGITVGGQGQKIINDFDNAIRKARSAKEQASVAPQVSVTDELKKFKELLDLDIITQEEFDAKKKQLLGL